MPLPPMPLFYLVPTEPLSEEIVQLNPRFQGENEGGTLSLVIRYDPQVEPAKAGQLASFGRHEQNDIRLPSTPPNCFRREHFFFFLADSGELIIRDLTTGKIGITYVDVSNVSREEARAADLQGTSVRQRAM